MQRILWWAPERILFCSREPRKMWKGETVPRLSAMLVGRASAEQTNVFTDTWALLSAQRIFVNVPSSQHFPVIGTVKRIRWRPQNRCLLLPKHCKKHPS